MDDSKFLIIGANGQLGTALQQQYPNARAVDAADLDITDTEALINFDWVNISTVLNAAAYTDVDGAETAEGRLAAWRVNASAVANLAQICRQKELTLLHISTDYVFDGSKTPHTETEEFSPLSAYGASKAAGDISAAGVAKHYILRASWVIGKGKNFVRTMLELGQKGVSPTVVADQIGRPTFTKELVRIIDHLLQNTPAYGTYNASNGGEPVSWAGLTRVVFSEAGFGLSVTDTSTAEYYAGKPEAAPRPLNSVLDLDKLEATGFTSRDWQEDLKDYIKEEMEDKQ